MKSVKSIHGDSEMFLLNISGYWKISSQYEQILCSVNIYEYRKVPGEYMWILEGFQWVDTENFPVNMSEYRKVLYGNWKMSCQYEWILRSVQTIWVDSESFSVNIELLSQYEGDIENILVNTEKYPVMNRYWEVSSQYMTERESAKLK